MPSAPVQQLDRVFAALADPTRRAILARLALGEATVNDLVVPFDLAQPTISKHLKVLEQAGLVSRGRSAQFRPVRLEAGPLAGVDQWIGGYRQFWAQSHDRLEAYVKTLQAEEASHDD
ncbi:metalloregulator ArsR/SmtB family transcription factor [Caulobacter sp. BE254]|uniref:ArsR/SmtB family transcription factor n=1 Tax=Caulobacter sp. BE254 TaxID=2817720 RepID=UPI002866BBE9|nr:metalloregulator ArsR/SmtB family transcription factor [Caulobacter sp. BE254]MDR7118502.1 DNA-binding transcriptional ArsR family regulator [Caulobacter sp. BE254]